MQILSGIIDRLLAVSGIIDYRMMDILHMDSDLMGPAGLEFDIKQCGIIVALLDLKKCDGFLGIFRRDAHHLPVLLTASDRSIDLPFIVFDDAAYDRVVFAIAGLVFQLIGKEAMCLIVFGADQKSRSIFVDPVDDARSVIAVDVGKFRAMV